MHQLLQCNNHPTITQQLVSPFSAKVRKLPNKQAAGIVSVVPLVDLFLTWGPDGVPGPLQTSPDMVLRRFWHRFLLLSVWVLLLHPPEERWHGGRTWPCRLDIRRTRP